MGISMIYNDYTTSASMYIYIILLLHIYPTVSQDQQSKHNDELEGTKVVLITIIAVNGGGSVIKGDWRGCNEGGGVTALRVLC